MLIDVLEICVEQFALKTLNLQSNKKNIATLPALPLFVRDQDDATIQLKKKTVGGGSVHNSSLLTFLANSF